MKYLGHVLLSMYLYNMTSAMGGGCCIFAIDKVCGDNSVQTKHKHLRTDVLHEKPDGSFVFLVVLIVIIHSTLEFNLTNIINYLCSILHQF